MDNPQPSPPLPHATTTAHGCATSHHALESLRSLIMKCAIASAPAKSLSLQQQSFIEKRIHDFAPTIHAPDHPPYAWMIENAIKHLNEEGGSDEEAISKFILEEYKDLPWAHAALLKHHLKRLSKSGNLAENHDGCYLIGRESITNGRASKPRLRITCTTSRSRSPSPSPSLSLSPSLTPSPSPSSSSSPTYASSDTSGSSQSFNLKRGRKKKRSCKRTKSQQRKQNARGTQIHPKYIKGRARGQGKGRGRGRGRGRSRGRGQYRSYGNPCMEDMMIEAYIGQVADDICMHGMQTVEIQCLLTEDEAADENENIQGKELTREQADQDYVDLGSQQQQSIVIDIDSPEHEYRIDEARIEPMQQNTGDDCSAPSTIRSSHRRNLTSEQGSKKVRQQKRSIHSRHTPQTGTRRGRPRKRETGSNMNLLEATEIGAVKVVNKRKTREQSQLKEDLGVEAYLMNDENTANMLEGEIQYANQVEQEEGDSMDELIDEVYVELTEATETLHLTIYDESAEENLKRKEFHQVENNQEEVNVEQPNELLSEQPLEIAEHDLPISKRTGTDNRPELRGRNGRECS